MPSPPLPYRPLEVKANGVWDPIKKKFYPWKTAYTSLNATLAAAKPGIAYYVHLIRTSAENHGDAAAAMNYCQIYIGGTPFALDAWAGTTTATSGVSSVVSSMAVVDVMADVNTAITAAVASSIGRISVVYAEIPVDEGEV